MNTLEISLSADSFLGNVFGKPMSRKRGKMSQKNWEKILKRITSSLRESIAKNLNSDEFHKWRINLYLDQLDEACDSEHNTEPEFILSIIGLIFELLGGTPNNAGRRRLNRKDEFKLNNLRSLIYIQTPSQKVETILEASRYEPYCDFHKRTDLFQRYMTKYNGNPTGFLEWYKGKYPDVYIKIF
jgi:hypothetical protein